MNTHADKTEKNQDQLLANEHTQKQSGGESTLKFIDNRPEAIAQRKLREVIDHSPQSIQIDAFRNMLDNNHQANSTDLVTQRKSVVQLKNRKEKKKQKREKAGLDKLYQAELLMTSIEEEEDAGEKTVFDVVRMAKEIIAGLAEQDAVIGALLECSDKIQTAVAKDASSLNYIVSTILRDYPSAKHVFVGIGESPEVLMGLLELQGARTASIVVSGVKNAVPKNEKEWENAINDINSFLDPWDSENIDLLLLDATDTKATLEVITNVIKRSDKNNGLSRAVKSASISATKTGDGGPEKLAGSDINVLDINDVNPDRSENKEGHKARQLIRERFFFQWYKENLGRSVEKRSFSAVIQGLDPEVEYNEDNQERIDIFTSAVHSFDSLNSKALRRAQALLERARVPLQQAQADRDAFIDAI